METPVKPMTQKRLRVHVIMLMCIVAAFFIFYFSPWWMSMITGQPVASFTVSILQPAAVVLFYLMLYTTVFLGVATIVQQAFSEKAFQWWGSRVAALFWLYMVLAVVLTAFIMGSLPSGQQP